MSDIERHREDYVRNFALAPLTPVIADPIQKVKVQFIGGPGQTCIELVEPLSPESPAHKVVQRGGGPYHICFEVADIEKSVGDAVDGGAICTSGIVPAAGFGGRRIAFLYYRNMGLVEFVEAAAV